MYAQLRRLLFPTTGVVATLMQPGDCSLANPYVLRRDALEP